MTQKRILLNAAATTEVGGSSADTQKPVVPSTPPAEVLKQDFSIDSADTELLGEIPEQKSTDTKIEKPSVKETPKTEVKVEQPAKASPSLLKSLPKKESRDYTGFAEDEVKVLKGMSNEAFNYIAPILKSRKETVSQPQQAFYQHPDAYILHPEYRQLAEHAQYAQSEAQAWQEQLIRVKSGESWTPLVGVDPKTGKFVYGPERQPTLQDEEMIRLAMNKCIQSQQDTTARLQQMPQQFQQVVQQDLQNINAERSRRFDWVANPELLKHEIELEGQGKKTVNDIRNDFINLFPAYHRGTPGVDVAADLFVAVNIYASRLRAAEAAAQVATTLKEEATRVEPTTAVRPRSPGKAAHGVTEFSLEGMPD